MRTIRLLLRGALAAAAVALACPGIAADAATPKAGAPGTCDFSRIDFDPATNTLTFPCTGTNPQPACNTAADQMSAFTVSAQKIVFSLRPGEVGAAAFTPVVGGQMVLSTTETIFTPPVADHEVTIAPCPGDFSATIPAQCRWAANYVGSSRFASINPTAPYQCPLNPGQRYYFNVRQVKLGTTVNSCPAGACQVRLQITGGLPGQ